MKKYTNEELQGIIKDHELWFVGAGGSRANLSDANLWGANLWALT